MISFFTNPRKIILLLIDTGLSFASIFIASLLRYGGEVPGSYIDLHLKLLLPFLIIRSTVFIGFKFYSKFWEYSTLEDLIEIVKAVVLGSFLSIFFFRKARQEQQEISGLS